MQPAIDQMFIMCLLSCDDLGVDQVLVDKVLIAMSIECDVYFM